MRLGGQTITILNPTQTGVDRLGVPTYSYVATTVSGCSVQESHTSRTITLTDVSSVLIKVFAPATAPLTTSSWVAVTDPDLLGSVANQAAMLALTGSVGAWCIRTDVGAAFYLTAPAPTLVGSWLKTPLFRADGYPALWKSPAGAPHHIECHLKQQQG